MDTATMNAAITVDIPLRALPSQYNQAEMADNPIKAHVVNETKKMFLVRLRCEGSLRLMKI
jgi:hypothetical protein